MTTSRPLGWAILAAGAVAVGLARADEADWTRDFKYAKELAAKRNLPILADFSGSDWCGWCIKLDKEVFSTPTFRDYAATNFVLLLVDFPQRKQQARQQIEQNEAMRKAYKVEGFPTVILMDAKGKEFGRAGYEAGGPTSYIDHIKGLLPATPATAPAAASTNAPATSPAK